MSRQQLLTRPENANFARSVVNRYWARFFGRGIINPIDDFSNRFKASHPELLDRLSKEFVQQGYDVAWLIRTIAVPVARMVALLSALAAQPAVPLE